jgi:hypothetical protein
VSTIVRAAIHPGIGIARVGNSTGEYFIGPEVPHPPHAPAGFYKDSTGALKRQAARFRIFGYDEAGDVAGELHAGNARITWTVHVANKKAAWYNLERALDIPEALPCRRRNASFTGEARRQLVIDPGPLSIAGRPDQDAVAFTGGTFLGRPVYLGELRTDTDGHLLFLGGRGVSETPFPNNSPYTFGNNDGWHDDVADGPISADVEIDGRRIPVDSAWIVVAPPNYAPDLISVQTMYDVLYDAYQNVWIRPVTRPSFREHVYPLLRQFADAQWVNQGFHFQFGWGGPNDFLREGYLDRLSTITRDESGVTDIFKELRLQILHMFRDPASTQAAPGKWPQMYGDAPELSNAARGYLALTPTQYQILKLWAGGQFVDDGPGQDDRPRRLEDVPLADRPATLDKAALWFCLGGPFHPGCELSWPMRTLTMYYAPFRIRPRAPGHPEPDYGDVLTPEVATSESGPLFANGPGDLTRWMAVPWQTDAGSCRSGYDPEYDPYLPTFWPVHVPNHVLDEEAYRTVMDGSRPKAERLQALDRRSVWTRWLKGEGLDQLSAMIGQFGRLGILERREGPTDAGYPPELFVESEVGFTHRPHFQKHLTVGGIEKLTRNRTRPLRPPE